VLISGILLGISQYSPRQYDKIHLIISSNEVGVFALEMSVSSAAGLNSPLPGSPSSNNNNNASGGSSTTVGREQVRMEDLLQAQFDNEQNLLLFEGMATFSINMLVHQINKSE
jgi:Ras GTPase-activating-like protein IQGAP2/3